MDGNQPGGGRLAGDEATVRLSLPAAPAFLQVARLSGSALASRAGFSIDEVDDVRIAIDELSTVLVQVAEREQAIELEFVLSPGNLAVTGRVPSRVAPSLSELTARILDVVVDRYELDTQGGNAGFALEKHSEVESAP